MNPTLKNVLAVVAGCIIGGIVNMAIIIGGTTLIGLPEGVNVMDPESLKANMHLFEFRHLIAPFLGHAIGTLAGAFIAAKIGASHKMRLALIIGVFFLIGGIMNIRSIGGPMAFNIIDLTLAYIPMAWLGGRLAGAEGKV